MPSLRQRRLRHSLPGPLLGACLLASCSAEPGTGPGLDRPPDLARLSQQAVPTQWQRLPGPGPERLRDPRTGITFVRIPAGQFVSDTDAVPRLLQVQRDFLLAETEWTVGQWRQTAELTGQLAVPVPDGDPDLPMPLSWSDAELACRLLGYRLPTEAEWERACRAEHQPTDAPWRSPAAVHEHAWFNANSGDGSRPVATRSANGFGLHDLLGNLWEWCQDWHGPLLPTSEPLPDPTGPATGTSKVLRGGSWFTGPMVGPQTRTTDFPSTRSALYGARPVREL